jgi:tyrosine-protein kinase Etk/Wzc
MTGNESKLSILDLLIKLAEMKKVFIISMLLFCAAGITVSLTMTKYYTATCVIVKPVNKLSSSLGALIGKEFSAASGLLKNMDLFGSNGSEQFLGILFSRRLAEQVIERFDLIHYYGFDKRKKMYIEDVLKAVNRSMEIVVDKYDDIAVSVTDTSPTMAANRANYMVQMLDSITYDLAKESAKYSRIFFAERLDIVKADLDSATKALAHFQALHNYIDLDEQVKSTIKAMAQIEAQKISIGMEIEQLKNKFSQNNREMQELTEKKAVMEKELQRFMNEGGGTLLLSLKHIPDDVTIYAQYFRNVKIQETLYGFVLQMVEQAKFMEANNTPSIQVLEWAKAPQKKMRPKRAVICFFFFVTGLAFTTIGILSLQWFCSQKKNMTPSYKKMAYLYSVLFNKK